MISGDEIFWDLIPSRKREPRYKLGLGATFLCADPMYVTAAWSTNAPLPRKRDRQQNPDFHQQHQAKNGRTYAQSDLNTANPLQISTSRTCYCNCDSGVYILYRRPQLPRWAISQFKCYFDAPVHIINCLLWQSCHYLPHALQVRCRNLRIPLPKKSQAGKPAQRCGIQYMWYCKSDCYF